VLPRRAAPARSTPPPPPLVAARDAAAAAALDGERTYIELPALAKPAVPPLLPPSLPRVDPARPATAPKTLPRMGLAAGVGLVVIALALVVRARLGSEAPAVPDSVAAPAAAGSAIPDLAAVAPTPTAPSPIAEQPVAVSDPQPVPVPTPGAPEPTGAAAPAAPAVVTPVATPTPARPRTAAPVRAATPVPTPSPTPEPTPAPPPRGQLSIDVRPSAQVEIDGRPLGTTPLAALTMEPGEHAVELTHPEFWPRRLRVVLYPGSQTRLEIDLAWEGVRRSSATPYRIPGGADAGLARAADLVAVTEWQEAVAVLEPLVRRLAEPGGRRGDLARAHFYLGVARLELGEATRATESFTAAVRLDSKLRPPAAAFPPRVLSFFNHVRSQAEAER
jgi:hypothetical protein